MPLRSPFLFPEVRQLGREKDIEKMCAACSFYRDSGFGALVALGNNHAEEGRIDGVDARGATVGLVPRRVTRARTALRQIYAFTT